MAKQYRVTNQARFFNRLMKFAIRTGIAPASLYILHVRGRKSGKSYSIPVSLVEKDNARWLVSPYGEVNWVQNVRSVGEVVLSKRGKTETRTVIEVRLQERASILKTYFDREGFARQFTAFTPETPLETYAEAAGDYPVFKLSA